MDSIESEPRKHPKPVPFFQDSIPSAVVPDVSLIFQDKFENEMEKKRNLSKETEFQTYNGWKWNHIKLNEKPSNRQPKANVLTVPSEVKECCLIKDKYASSDIEKRKNEILYGQEDEPRRPLPPRENPEIPKCNESFFNNSSFDDLRWVGSGFKESQSKILSPSKNSVKINTLPVSKLDDLRPRFENSEKLYSIIMEQNKQSVVLQKQIEQLLKLQEVKDKQIEQLLKSQESKEKKIEQLLQNLEIKDRELVELLKSKGKLEQHIQDLLKSQEAKHMETLQLLRKIENTPRKEFISKGTMTILEVVESSTNTSEDFVSNQRCDKKNTPEDDVSILRDCNETSGFNGKDKSLSLHSMDLPVIEEHMPTPQSSIHLDIQDFNNSSDESDSGDFSVKCPTTTQHFSSPLGCTFYNNVLTQVKEIIENSGEAERNTLNAEKFENKQTKRVENKGNQNMFQSFQAWGVNVFERGLPSSHENEEHMNSEERFKYNTSSPYDKDTISPSDISLKINALALKYLKQEQIPQHEVQSQLQGPRPDVTIYNVTNLSFGSMRYLDRILPGVKANLQQETKSHQNECSPAKMLIRKKKMNRHENLYTGNILDISTLNQQTKLL